MRWICFAFLLSCASQLIAAEDNVELKSIEAKGSQMRVMVASPEGNRECHVFFEFKYEGKELLIRQQAGNLDTEKNCKLVLAIDKKTKAVAVHRVEQHGVILFNKEGDKPK